MGSVAALCSQRLLAILVPGDGRQATVVITAFVWTLFVLLYLRKALIPFVLWALLPLALVLWYNTAINGSPLVFGYQEGVVQFFSWPHEEAIVGCW